MNYIQITIAVPDAHVGDILIARLSEGGYEGFEEEGMPGTNEKMPGTDEKMPGSWGQAGLLHAFIPEEKFDAADKNS